jgi:PadR family transcriptional regulator, regulatory protein PadR
MTLPTGTVYPALWLKRARWIASSWETVNGSQRRTYRLTRSGRHALGPRRVEWRDFQQVIGTVLGTESWPATR